MLEEFGRDLTNLASLGALDPLIGRREELNKLCDILCLEGKNNPVLLGPPGVGKTCIAEGFAQLLASGEVPEPLKGKKLFQIDFAAVASGTIYRGMLEARVEKIIAELTANKNVILFIDEIHQIVNTRCSGGFDFANYLKPYLARGDFPVIGATTEEEFKRLIEEGDPALARRFIRIKVNEPPLADVKTLLIRMGKRFGAKYRVVVPEVTIDHLITLSDRYIKDRFFPDKALDILKEAMAEKRFRTTNSQQRKSLRNMEALLDEEIGRIKAQEFPAIESSLERWDREKEDFSLTALALEDIAAIIATRTGAVVSDGQLTEVGLRIKSLKEGFGTRIIGQRRAKDAIMGAIKMLGAGIRKPNKPIGSFLFLGPSGTGKTETAKTIAATFFGSEKRLIRFDMSEFYDDHTMARLVGSPPGYIGSDEDGLLVKLMRQNPFSVVLFDEIEKADPKLFDIFLQMLDEGYVKDMKGNTASFKEALVIITSNVGTQFYSGLEQHQFDEKFEAIQARVLEELKRTVRPEIINRIDNIIPFAPFTKDELMLVFRKLADESAKHIFEQKQIQYRVSDAAVRLAVELGYDAQFGARPMRREIHRIEELIAEAVLERKIAANDRLMIDAEDKKYQLKKEYE